MKKLLGILTVFCVAASAWSETVFTFSAAADMSQTKDGISLSIAKGSGQTAPAFQNQYYLSEYHPEMRLYVGNTITISSESFFSDIQLVFALAGSGKAYAGLESDKGTLTSGGVSTDKTDWVVDHWIGSETSVVFTLVNGKQRQLQKIVVDGSPIEINPIEISLPTEADLDINYSYEEPTLVSVPDTTILKNEYAFISNNILVYCGQGSIIKATDTTAAYFNCNANYTLTFTATESIKGIEIDGFVRKAFSATCDHGEIEYLTDTDYDMEGSPAMVIRNIDATSVTISCPKQLRCYGVRVYFQEDPEHLNPETGIEGIQPSAVRSQKILRDGALYIIQNERTYTATGVEIR